MIQSINVFVLCFFLSMTSLSGTPSGTNRQGIIFFNRILISFVLFHSLSMVSVEAYNGQGFYFFYLFTNCEKNNTRYTYTL